MNTTPSDAVRLFLDGDPRMDSQSLDDRLYLQIPLDRIKIICKHPAKYLRFLAYYILHCEGVVCHYDLVLDDLADVQGGGAYYYRRGGPGTEGLYSRIVDVEVIKSPSAYDYSPEEPGPSERRFRSQLIRRDGNCVFSETEFDMCEAAHIIPNPISNDWLSCIFATCPIGRTVSDEDIIQDSNDIRNGILVSANVHRAMRFHHAAVLPTPNHVLTTDDVPTKAPRELLSDEVYPQDDRRYTLQWFSHLRGLPTDVNTDAAFPPTTTLSPNNRPSTFLLLYVYAATALSKWGHVPASYSAFLAAPENQRRPEKTTSASRHQWEGGTYADEDSEQSEGEEKSFGKATSE
ncbi:hypothetical protein EIP91_000496 [Steccherinum ochraceum]|uniref:HNH nuclease domain-containing protein n=1 Tax=Steccherinum ochraceum TaxID=92696 RepID=A0A4R0S1A8_9APHY|nr:hypothetical protein EIP91_000496 [Steccherinum ochraceum]